MINTVQEANKSNQLSKFPKEHLWNELIWIILQDVSVRDYPCGDIKEEKGIQVRKQQNVMSIDSSNFTENGSHAPGTGRD